MDKVVELLKSCDRFKHNTYYWNHDVLTPEENYIRNYPAPWINKTIELLKILDAKVVVEIGSTRMELTSKCIEYFNNSYRVESKEAPACCQDGHSTYFWANAGFETYTVDIDSRCKEILQSQYKHHVKKDIPDNLHIFIPTDGIQFLTNFDKQIDLLYLDGWNKGEYQYAEKHLEAFLAAKNKLSKNHLISIDDTDFDTESAGKDKYLTPHLLENGYIRILWGRQVVYLKYHN